MSLVEIKLAQLGQVKKLQVCLVKSSQQEPTKENSVKSAMNNLANLMWREFGKLVWWGMMMSFNWWIN